MTVENEQIEDRAKKLRNLKSFEGKTDEEIFERAKELLEQEDVDIDISLLFANKKERTQAYVLLQKYLKDYTLESISDKNTIKECVYLEIVQQRLQEKLDGFYKDDKKAVPSQLVEIIHKNSKAILDLKNSLGLNRGKEKKESGFDALEKLNKRFKRWLIENQASRALGCPHCGKMIMLKMKVEAWEALQHPFFRDRILGNEHLVHMYQNAKISKEDVAKVLEVSSDYVDWLIEKWNLGLERNEKEPEVKSKSQKRRIAIQKESENVEVERQGKEREEEAESGQESKEE